MKKLLVFSFVMMLALTLTACGAQVQSVALAADIMLEQSKTAQLAPEYTFDKELASDALAEAVAKLAPVYTTSDESVATVDASGRVTAVDGGTATISMALGKDINAQCTVTVTVPVQSVTADSSLALALNGTESGSVNARVIPSNATAALLTYESSDETVATVDSTGKVTAVGNGEAVIIVSCEDKTTQTKVTVTTKATSIRLEQGSGGTLAVGGGIKLVARTVPAEAEASTYSYASDNAKVATVNAEGQITGVSTGKANITVTSADGHTAVYTATVAVKCGYCGQLGHNASNCPVQKAAAAKAAAAKAAAGKKPSGGNAATGGSAAAGGGASVGGGDAGGGAPAPAPAPEPEPAPPPSDVVAGLPVTPGDGTGGGMAGGD